MVTEYFHFTTSPQEWEPDKGFPFSFPQNQDPCSWDSLPQFLKFLIFVLPTCPCSQKFSVRKNKKWKSLEPRTQGQEFLTFSLDFKGLQSDLPAVVVTWVRRARVLKRTGDSGAWGCSYEKGKYLKCMCTCPFIIIITSYFIFISDCCLISNSLEHFSF